MYMCTCVYAFSVAVAIVHVSGCVHCSPSLSCLCRQKKLFYTPHNVQQTIEELRDPWVGPSVTKTCACSLAYLTAITAELTSSHGRNYYISRDYGACVSGGVKCSGHFITIVTIVQIMQCVLSDLL